MNVFHKNRALPRLSCVQAAAHCALLWIIPPVWLGSPSPSALWLEKNGSLHCDKRTFTANTAIKKSLSSSGLKCPEEACTCSVWVPEAERLTKQHQPHQQPPGTRLRIQSDRRKWLKTTDGGDMRPRKRLFSTLLAFNWNILEPPVPGPKNRASPQKTQW